MERNPWKLATIGLALVGTTALGTGLTTSYLMRTPTAAAGQEAAVAPRTSTTPRVIVVQHPTSRPAAPVGAPRVTPVATTAIPADCDTAGERAMRIAKPGLIGGLLGAGLGAAGGAIADGGKAAGKGALIGGLAGAALGGGYGAYKTQNECGTIFGGTGAAPVTQALGATGGQGITVYR